MSVLLPAVAAFLLLTLALGLVRIWRGPTAADRMLAGQLFSTTGVALLLVLAESQAIPALRDVALVLVVLSVLAVVAFVARADVGPGPRGTGSGGPGALDTDG